MIKHVQEGESFLRIGDENLLDKVLSLLRNLLLVKVALLQIQIGDL